MIDCRIEDYLFLGSEWNASNLDELTQNSITHILNVTREIDNFFPGNFRYLNVRVYDEETTDLVSNFLKRGKDIEYGNTEYNDIQT
jgi:protein phosphatase slingshot